MHLRIKELDYVISDKICALETIMFFSDYYYDEYPFLKAPEYPLWSEIIEHCLPHKNHAAVELFTEKAKAGFAFEKPYEYAFNDVSDAFGIALNDYIKQTALEEFLNEKQEILTKIINQSAVMDVDVPKLLKEFYNVEEDVPFEVYPLLGTGNGCGFGSRRPNGIRTALTGLFYLDNGIPVFFNSPESYNLLIHEFSHGFINHIIDEIDIEQDILDKHCLPLTDEMKGMYGATKDMISEQVVRAVTIHLLAEHVDKDYANQKLEEDKAWGFLLVEDICELLRTKYDKGECSFQEFIENYVKERLQDRIIK